MSAPSASSTEAARVGPNAVIQLGETLCAHGERSLAQAVYAAAGLSEWLERPPQAMIAEADAARLHGALHQLAPPGLARARAREAGLRTGDYILAHRIPAPAQRLLRWLPAALAAPLLVRAIAAHAWTFAGSGAFSFAGRRPLTVTIAANPLAGPPGAEPACVWHAAVFERLFRVLVHPRTRVREISCCAAGAAACRFEISWRPEPT